MSTFRTYPYEKHEPRVYTPRLRWEAKPHCPGLYARAEVGRELHVVLDRVATQWLAFGPHGELVTRPTGELTWPSEAEAIEAVEARLPADEARALAEALGAPNGGEEEGSAEVEQALAHAADEDKAIRILNALRVCELLHAAFQAGEASGSVSWGAIEEAAALAAMVVEQGGER